MSTLIDERGAQHSLSLDDYHRMIELGVLGVQDCVELLDGQVVEAPPMTARHATQVQILNTFLIQQILSRGLEDELYLRSQLPLILHHDSEVQPDFVLLRDPPQPDQHPCAARASLIIEVCDTAFFKDREDKLPRYAASGVPEVWMLDVRDMQPPKLLVHRALENGQYTDKSRVVGKLHAQRIPELPLKVEDLLTSPRSCGAVAKSQ